MIKGGKRREHERPFLPPQYMVTFQGKKILPLHCPLGQEPTVPVTSCLKPHQQDCSAKWHIPPKPLVLLVTVKISSIYLPFSKSCLWEYYTEKHILIYTLQKCFETVYRDSYRALCRSYWKKYSKGQNQESSW